MKKGNEEVLQNRDGVTKKLESVRYCQQLAIVDCFPWGISNDGQRWFTMSSEDSPQEYGTNPGRFPQKDERQHKESGIAHSFPLIRAPLEPFAPNCLYTYGQLDIADSSTTEFISTISELGDLFSLAV